MASDPRDEAEDVAIAAPIRAACADLHPSDALRAAVMLGLSPRAPAASPSRRWRLVAAVGGLAAAVAVGIALWPHGSEPTGTPQVSTPPTSVAAPDRAIDDAAIAAERAADRAWFDKEWPALRDKEKGKWVVIAMGGNVYASAPDLDKLRPIFGMSPQPKHRYVFRAGEEGDVTTFASEWYAPRFAGSGFAKALGVSTMQADNAMVVSKGDERLEAKGATPFPRLLVVFTPLDGSVPPTPSELWLGSVGPALMLTPEDDARLSLARWEVPGVETVMDMPCRRVLVDATILGIRGSATVIGTVPTVPRERLVGLARARDRFWEWPDSLRSMLDLPGEGDARGQWIVFGANRVLGRGLSAETALADGDAQMRDVVYHRYVLRWPRAVARPVGSDSFTEPCALSIGGTSWKDSTVLAARRCPDPESYAVAALDDGTWTALGLGLAESDGVVIRDQEESKPAQPAPRAASFGRQAYVRARVSRIEDGGSVPPSEPRWVLVVETREAKIAAERTPAPATKLTPAKVIQTYKGYSRDQLADPSSREVTVETLLEIVTDEKIEGAIREEAASAIYGPETAKNDADLDWTTGKGLQRPRAVFSIRVLPLLVKPGRDPEDIFVRQSADLILKGLWPAIATQKEPEINACKPRSLESCVQAKAAWERWLAK